MKVDKMTDEQLKNSYIKSLDEEFDVSSYKAFETFLIDKLWIHEKRDFKMEMIIKGLKDIKEM